MIYTIREYMLDVYSMQHGGWVADYLAYSGMWEWYMYYTHDFVQVSRAL